jgi:uncharacterized protein YkwD
MTRSARFAAAALVFGILACAPPPRPALPPSVRPQPRVEASSLERRIHQLINRERRKHGLSALEWNAVLARIARGHSRDMAQRDYFSHDSPEGNDFSFRYRAGGFTCAIREGSYLHGGAENIFQNNRYDSVTTVNGKAYYDWNTEDELAETTVRGWMCSPGHRKNILTPHWRTEGIGVHPGPTEKIYITQNFC